MLLNIILLIRYTIMINIILNIIINKIPLILHDSPFIFKHLLLRSRTNLSHNRL